MRILVVGGTGLIGGTCALLLARLGHEVTIAARKPAPPASALAPLPYRALDYTDTARAEAALSGHDALVFSAGNDIRHRPAGAGDEHWHRANSIAAPAFFRAARAAGIARAVNVGSFYTQVMPELAETNAYVRSRIEAEAGIAALAGPGFAALSVNAPLVVGRLAGVSVPFFDAHARFALGERPDIPEFVPPGGVNFISSRSLAEAIIGALLHGEAGASYLVGDENLSFERYFGLYFEAAGRPPPPVRDADAPIFPDRSIYFGRGNSLFYEPDPDEVRLLGYRRGDVTPTIRTIMAEEVARRAAAAPAEPPPARREAPAGASTAAAGFIEGRHR